MGKSSNESGPKWTPEVVSRLGKEPDEWLANDLYVSPAEVRQQRRTRGIPQWTAPGHWQKDELALLGTALDKEVARRTGRTPAAVKRKRRLMGITSYRQRQKEARKLAEAKAAGR